MSDIDQDRPGDAETDSAATRWRFTNDVLAAIVLLTLAAVTVVTLRYNYQIPTEIWAVFATVALLAAVWTFGAQAVAALKKLRG